MKDQRIQTFRAMAIIAVVMVHTMPSGNWQIFLRPLINFPVATFLFLSGYLTRESNENWSAFYRRRLSRIAVPYIVWTVIYSLPDISSFRPQLLSPTVSPAPTAKPSRSAESSKL